VEVEGEEQRIAHVLTYYSWDGCGRMDDFLGCFFVGALV
jgi:hypothetical protein